MFGNSRKINQAAMSAAVKGMKKDKLLKKGSGGHSCDGGFIGKKPCIVCNPR